jgi:hypothetical protein
MSESFEIGLSNAFDNDTEEEKDTAARYEALLRSADAKKGRRLVRVICEQCRSKRGDVVVATVFASRHGPFWRSERPFANPATVVKARGGPRIPSMYLVDLALLDVPLDCRRRANGQIELLRARCHWHGDLEIDERAIVSAVANCQTKQKEQLVRV